MSQPPSNQIPSNLSKNNHQVNVNYPIHNNNNNYNNNNIEKKDRNNQILQKRKKEENEKVPLQNKRQKTIENSEINQEIKEQDDNINENNNHDNNENNNLNNFNLDKSSMIFIVCDPDEKERAKISFSKISVKEHLERHKTNRLTYDHLDKISKEYEENVFIFNLFDGLKSGQNLYGSLHHSNQILIISKEQFSSLMKKKKKKASDESQKRKIKDCLSEVSNKFHFKKVDETSSDSSSVIKYLKGIYNQNDNNNNNKKSNDNNNNNDNKNKLYVGQPHSPQTNAIDENILNVIENDNNNKDNNFDHRNNNNDPMKIDNYSVERFPPKFSPDPNLPFDPFDLLSIGRNGEGFDDEILGYICSMEQIDSESLDSFINSF